MLKSYCLIWALFTAPERRRFLLLIALTVLAAVLELMGVAGIFPFLTVLADPTLVDSHWALVSFASFFGLQTHVSVEIGLGIAVFVVLFLSMAARAAVTYAHIRFSLMRSYSLSSRLLKGYLAQDYIWFLQRNSADLGQALLSETDFVIREGVLPAVLLISNVLVLLVIGALLFVVDPLVAMLASGLLIGVYLLSYLLLRRPLTRSGRKRAEASRERFQVVQEVVGGLKEIKVMGLEAISLGRFRLPAQTMARHQAIGLVIARLPRFAMETAAYGGFILMVIFMIALRGGSMGDLVPLLGLLGLAAARMFPALQQAFQNLSGMRFSLPALQRLHDALAEQPPQRPQVLEPALRLTRELRLKDIRYRYPSGERDTIDHLTLTIPAQGSVGVVGGTGAGKTTLIDLILGLLAPDAGEIHIDGELLTPGRIRAWQRNLGYVPQAIFLTDDTVAANIAFGQPHEMIDMARVQDAARLANLHDFITRDLPDGYRTLVGERGVRLSGGQRQRIGIARALYGDPDVLVLDEATSALDNMTERAVMEAVAALGKRKTVIMIAHRLSTVEGCDMILMLERGRLVAQGSYAELLSGNAGFRRLAGWSSAAPEGE